MGQALKRINPITDKADMREMRRIMPAFILLGVSIFVFMDMETRLSDLRKNVRHSMSEREFEQQKNYNQIMEQISEYDGEGNALQDPDELEKSPTYKYQFIEGEDE
jgi:hypothetical protein